jgi:hypothetical protein
MSLTDRMGLREKIRAKKRQVTGMGPNGALGVEDCADYPLLTELLTTAAQVRGAEKGGRLAFWIQDGRLTCCLTMPAEGAVAFVALDGFGEAFMHLERALGGDKLDWRQERPQRAR